ncbi:MAG TPA: substrate-binding domain-containing protein [Candidatus Limnocylindrales bacterium]|nr:substrate-binding domain-containing protein [Candidatus Limnocylindrales bacterium]
MDRRFGLLVGVVAILAAACSSSGGSPAASAGASAAAANPLGSSGTGCTVGVSWNNFQQPRWAAHDKPNIQRTVEGAGGKYIDADANLSNEQQATDIDTMISKGAKVLIVLAQDTQAVLPSIAKAKAAGIPVIAYDRLIEDSSALYITFDNVAVGKAEADAVIKKVPKGNYVLIKGDPGDPNAKTFLPQGWDQAGLKDKVTSGDIKIIGPADGTYTDAWKTEKAQSNMEAIIDSAVSSNTKIDAILAENDSTALGVVGALTGKSYGYPPLSGQDGDTANLNNVALGRQYVDIWKNANELGKTAAAAALALCNGGKMDSLTLPANFIDPNVAPVAGLSSKPFTTPGGNTVSSFILQPTPITADNLQVVIDGGQITKAELCKGVDASTAPAACK